MLRVTLLCVGNERMPVLVHGRVPCVPHALRVLVGELRDPRPPPHRQPGLTAPVLLHDVLLMSLRGGGYGVSCTRTIANFENGFDCLCVHVCVHC